MCGPPGYFLVLLLWWWWLFSSELFQFLFENWYLGFSKRLCASPQYLCLYSLLMAGWPNCHWPNWLAHFVLERVGGVVHFEVSFVEEKASFFPPPTYLSSF